MSEPSQPAKAATEEQPLLLLLQVFIYIYIYNTVVYMADLRKQGRMLYHRWHFRPVSIARSSSPKLLRTNHCSTSLVRTDNKIIQGCCLTEEHESGGSGSHHITSYGDETNDRPAEFNSPYTS